jgi:hypothetical protein
MKTRIWNLTETFPGKVNFIDSNNVILGYDLGQSCCEHAFWTISDCPLCSTAPPVGSESSKPVTNQIMFYIGMAIWSLYLLSTVW